MVTACASATPAAPSPTQSAAAPAAAQPTTAPAAAAAGNSVIQCGQPVTLRYATSLAEDSAYYKGAVALKDAVEQKSNGCIKMQIFANAALGTDQDMVEGMQMGSIDMASPSTGATGSVVPEATILDLPYLFDDYKHVYAVMDGPIGSQDIYRMYDGAGFHPLGYWEIGFRNLTTKSKPVQTPADIAGLKLRTLSSKIHQTAWSLVGAQPVAIDFTELYNALSTGVVDGQENPYNIILTGKLYEVQKYLSVTNHVYGVAPTSISDKTFARLSPELQKVLKEAVDVSTVAQRKAASGDVNAQLQQLKQFGMQVIENPDREAFRKTMAPAWKEYTDRYGQKGQDLIDRIRSTKY